VGVFIGAELAEVAVAQVGEAPDGCVLVGGVGFGAFFVFVFVGAGGGGGIEAEA